MNHKIIIMLKTCFVVFIFSLFCNQLSAQYTNGIFFQAVARDNFSNPAKDRKIYIQSSIIQTSPSGTKVLTEEHQANTDATGVFSISLGNGIRVGGTATSLTTIDWSKGPFYLNLKVAITPIGGNSAWDYTKEWVDMGTTSFGAVPFALYSASSAKVDDKLNVNDTTKMLAVYAKAMAVKSLETVIASKLTAADTLSMLAPYAKVAYTIDSDFFKTQLATKLSISDSSKYVTPVQLAAKTFDQTPINNAITAKLNITDTITLSNRIDLKASQSDLTNLTTRVDGNTASITANKASIDLKASQSDLTNLTTRVDGNTASITANTASIDLKASQSDLTNLTTRVDGNTASITANTASIDLKASQSDLTNLTTRVDGNTASITSNKASIDLKASQSDLTNLTTRVDGNTLSITNLATVARSGSYTDLLNLPTSITASTLTGTVAISKGGTGAVTANAAFNALAPDQASKSGKFLTTDGTSTSWASVASNLPTTVNTSSSYNIVMATDQNLSLVTGTGNGGTTATLNPYTGQMNISGATVGGYGLATSGKLTVGSIAPAVTSAQLEVNSTNKGFLPPRMTLAQRSQIYAPVQGLMIMCTDCSTQGEVQVYTGSYWSNVAGALPTTTVGTVTAPLVGAAYQGGKVAYILTPADPGYDHKKVKGFIIALQDLPSDYPLRSGSVYISTIANSGTAVGDGLVNTNLLVAAYGNTNIHAAKAANDYSITEAGVVYDDWYLPSKDEMKIIYDNRVVLNAGFNANTDKWYWTSSYASNSNGGWRLTFVNGYIGAQGSESSYFVRPIRYFSIDKNIDISASTFTGSLVGNAASATLANTATTAVNITATTNNSLTSLPNLATVGSISSGIWSASTIDIAHGGTGSTSQNFVDLSSDQNSIGGSKTFTNNIVANGINIGKGGGGSSTLLGNATSANDNSTAIGFMALNGNSGINNTALGANTMRNSGSTANTTAVGVIAGQNSNTGNNNTFIGYAASVPDGSSISNSTAIGSGATVTNSNTIQLGADGANGFTAIESVKTTGTLTTGAVTYPKSHGSNGQVLSTTGSGTLTWTTISSTTNASTLTGTINVVNGGTGATSLTGYLKGNGTNAFTSSNTIPASDVSGLIIKVNGSLPDANGYVTIPFGSVTTGTLGNRPISAGTNGNIYVVSGDATTSDNGRTYISDGSNWNEVTTNQAATDARYFQLAGGTLNGSLTIPANKILTVTDVPINSTDAANKRYVDDAISTSAISATTSSTLGKIQLSGDLAGVGSTAINPKVGSVGGSTAALINSAEVLANAAVSTNTANQIVKRDVIGNFSAGTISANLTGNVTGDVTGNISGTSRNVTGIVNVVNGGTGTSTLTGYLKGNGMTAFSASSTIPASDITGLIKKVNGSIPDADGNVAISFGTVSTGSLTNRPVSAGTNGNIYVVSGDATSAENGRTFISDGTSWKEVTSNQSATDARYLKLAGGTMAGNIVIPTTNKITITDAPVSSSDAVNKAYVDASSASASVADATTTSLGKIQLSGDLAGSGTSATNPKVSSVGGSTAALINAAEIATNAATYSNTANQIVKRDGSGNFSAGTITANLIGNVTGNATNVTDVVIGANGGTGVANTGKTITLGGNFEIGHALKFTTTAPTTLTLPSSGTLATVQQLDAKELLSNKSSDVNLGTSNDKFPTQNAVKSYVDGKVSSNSGLNSPAFTGTPTAPTAATGTITTQIATTEFVKNTVYAPRNEFYIGVNNNLGLGSFTASPLQSGRRNTTIGVGTITSKNAGDNNTAIGYEAGKIFGTGTSQVSTVNNGVYIGANTKPKANDQTNEIVIGYDALGTGSNTVRIGNDAITSIGGFVAWSTASDIRLKKNIINTQYGLNTVLKFRPVEYELIKNNLKQVGFIAQEIKKLVPEVITGIEGDLDKGETLGITYSNLVPVLTKAIQEQHEIIEELIKANKKNEDDIKRLTKLIENLIKNK